MLPRRLLTLLAALCLFASTAIAQATTSTFTTRKQIALKRCLTRAAKAPKPASARRACRRKERPRHPVTTHAPVLPGPAPVVAATNPASAPQTAPAAAATATPSPSPTPAATAAATPRPSLFAASSFWNKPLDADAAIDPKSATYVQTLNGQLNNWVPWINSSEWSSTIYTVPRSQPTMRVQLDNYPGDLQAAWNAVPIPENARPATGTDGHMVVYQPSTDRMWEFWRASTQDDGWHAVYGGYMDHVSSNPGYYENGWGATATGLPLIGGIMRLDELAAGRIDHALAIALPRTSSAAFAWPAQRTDGNDAASGAIPEGTRFRLDPALDLSKLSMTPTVRAMAVAAQRYGVVVRDVSGSVSFYGEDPGPTNSSLYDQLYGSLYPDQMLRQFPWASLKALKAPLTTVR